MKKNFEAPVIIGALCARDTKLPPPLKKAFAKLKPRFALLALGVEKRHLKNLIECMKLMDVRGLILLGRLKRDVVPYLTRLDAESRKIGSVDIIIRENRRFKGISVKRETGAVGNYCQTCVKVLTGNVKSI